MTTIETLIVVILTIVLLPYLCRLINRPSLLYCAYILVGVACGDFMGIYTRSMLQEVGKVGFTLLLFLIGLEIELPPFKTIKKSVPFCLTWFIFQIPLLMFVGWCLDLPLGFVLIAAGGITACSLSIAYGVLKGQTQLEQSTATRVVVEMVLLEVIALVILALSEVVYEHGWGQEVIWQGISLFGFILLIRIFSGFIHKQLSRIVEVQGKWQIHYVLLIIFVVAIIGERLGLSAPKTAFFLGLFMSETSQNGVKFEDELQPIAKGILIPVFFLSLGTRISLDGIFPWVLPIALAISMVLFGLRWCQLHSLNHPLSSKFFMVYCPNITMTAVAAEILVHHNAPKDQVDLLLVTGLVMTVVPALMFPSPEKTPMSVPAI